MEVVDFTGELAVFVIADDSEDFPVFIDRGWYRELGEGSPRGRALRADVNGSVSYPIGKPHSIVKQFRNVKSMFPDSWAGPPVPCPYLLDPIQGGPYALVNRDEVGSVVHLDRRRSPDSRTELCLIPANEER